MPFRPLADRVLIRRDVASDKVGSLFVAETSRSKPRWGTVVATGPGALSPEGARLPMSVEPGMRVLFGKFGGDEIEVDDETLLVVRETEIIGVDFPEE